MDLYIPATPDAGGPHLAALLSVDPNRRAVFHNIVARLEPGGLLGDCARYYIVREQFRRATLRSVLSATGQRFPEWARESAAAGRQNDAFVAAYRETYNAFRRGARVEAKAQRVAALGVGPVAA